MPDGLSDEERILSWVASWTPSFDGWAIVNEDFTFRSVNQQFCDICGVTPAEIIGQKFSDITPAHIRKLDEANAKLIRQGKMRSYILPKSYEFASGAKVDVMLLVVGVFDQNDKFLHYVSRIMQHAPENLKTESGYMLPVPLQGVFAGLAFLKSIWGIFTVIGGGIAAIIYWVIKKGVAL